MTFWISFADEHQSRGCCIVDGASKMHALERVAELDINPGGDAMIIDITDNPIAQEVIERYGKDRLIPRELLVEDEDMTRTGEIETHDELAEFLEMNATYIKEEYT